ncbi:unnamed protein product, partial [Prorocentrum cordatum]
VPAGADRARSAGTREGAGPPEPAEDLPRLPGGSARASAAPAGCPPAAGAAAAPRAPDAPIGPAPLAAAAGGLLTSGQIGQAAMEALQQSQIVNGMATWALEEGAAQRVRSRPADTSACGLQDGLARPERAVLAATAQGASSAAGGADAAISQRSASVTSGLARLDIAKEAPEEPCGAALWRPSVAVPGARVALDSSCSDLDGPTVLVEGAASAAQARGREAADEAVEVLRRAEALSAAQARGREAADEAVEVLSCPEGRGAEPGRGAGPPRRRPRLGPRARRRPGGRPHPATARGRRRGSRAGRRLQRALGRARPSAAAAPGHPPRRRSSRGGGPRPALGRARPGAAAARGAGGDGARGQRRSSPGGRRLQRALRRARRAAAVQGRRRGPCGGRLRQRSGPGGARGGRRPRRAGARGGGERGRRGGVHGRVLRGRRGGVPGGGPVGARGARGLRRVRRRLRVGAQRVVPPVPLRPWVCRAARPRCKG